MYSNIVKGRCFNIIKKPFFARLFRILAGINKFPVNKGLRREHLSKEFCSLGRSQDVEEKPIKWTQTCVSSLCYFKMLSYRFPRKEMKPAADGELRQSVCSERKLQQNKSQYPLSRNTELYNPHRLILSATTNSVQIEEIVLEEISPETVLPVFASFSLQTLRF